MNFLAFVPDDHDMPETTRTFIAIPIPESIGEQLSHRQAALAPEIPGCRWTAGTPFHMTLAFLGDVRNRDLSALCLAVAEAAEPFEPLELRLESLGAFPSPQKPRVIWTGVTAPNLNSLLDLREAVVRAVTRAGYRPDDPRFHPHVTLGRIKPYRVRPDEPSNDRLAQVTLGPIKSNRGRPHDLTSLIEREHAWSAGTFTAVEVVTYASTLDTKGSVYAPLGRARLAGKKNTQRP